VFVYSCLEDIQTTVPGKELSVYTDGSCDPVSGIGGWAAIILEDGGNVLLSGKETDTNHHRMEITAALCALRHIQSTASGNRPIVLFTDSQYLANLPQRKDKLLAAGMRTRKGDILRNRDLLVQLFALLDTLMIAIVKVPSHEKAGNLWNYNREVDKLSRKIVREAVRDCKGL